MTYLMIEMEDSGTTEAAAIFMDRIVLEKPTFVASEFLGFGAIKLLGLVDTFSKTAVNRFLNIDAISDSIVLFEAQYERRDGMYKKRLRGLKEFPSTKLALPVYVPIPPSLLSR